MALSADFHVHTCHSGDSEEPMEQMVEAAIKQGFTDICFTDHEDMDFPDSPDEPGSIFLLDKAAYRREFLELRERYSGRIRLHYGVELGLQPQIVDKNKNFLAGEPFEFIIGSIHLVNGRDPYYPVFYEGHGMEEIFRELFACTMDNLRAFHDIDVLGHMDYILRYSPWGEDAYRPSDFTDQIDEILRFIIDAGIGLDVNTAPIRKGFKNPNPAPFILRRYRQLGGEIITIGSDAHDQASLGHSFSYVRDLLLDLDFRHYFIYTDRHPEARAL